MPESPRCRCPCTCGHSHGKKPGTCIWCMTARIAKMRKAIKEAMGILSDGDPE